MIKESVVEFENGRIIIGGDFFVRIRELGVMERKGEQIGKVEIK